MSTCTPARHRLQRQRRSRPPITQSAPGGRNLGRLLITTGAAGTGASWQLTLDKIRLLEDPAFLPGCSLSPVVSCGSVMNSAQAAVLGFPNSLIGLITYPMLATAGIILLGRARPGRSFIYGLLAATAAGTGFVTWLQYQSLYSNGALCLWCALAWAATIPAFCGVLTHAVGTDDLPAPRKLRAARSEFGWVLPVLWLGAVTIAVLIRWWPYWSTFL